ncbi:MAG: hypothetical protein J2P35_14215, partial [Actinobacteria bacterium]|nr:hypothetical protein [Actinomycetota bacterium]
MTSLTSSMPSPAAFGAVTGPADELPFITGNLLKERLLLRDEPQFKASPDHRAIPGQIRGRTDTGARARPAGGAK